MHTITLASGGSYACRDDDTVLRAALRGGLGFPYECNVGSCGNCLFELVAGNVTHMRAHAPAWNEKHRKRNRWLGCQSRPHGDCTIKVRLADTYVSRFRPVLGGATLDRVVEVNHDIREFHVRRDEPVRFLPGQYALLTLAGIEEPRAYSMSSTGEDGADWQFQIRRVPGGRVTSHLFDVLAPGDRLTIDGPFGMAYLREAAPRDLVCLAGGSGLSPMVAIARAAMHSEKLAGRTLNFVYGGRTARDICGEAFLRELPGWGARIAFHPVVSMPDGGDWSGRTGFVHDAVRDMFGDTLPQHEIYFAGPPAMSEAVQRLCFEMKVPPEQVHFDQFY